MPIAIPKGVDVSITTDQISVKGSGGTLVRPVNALVTVKNEDGKLMFAPANDSREANAMSGTMRALVNNMVDGVTKGFEKKLNLVGVGYRAAAQGAKLNLQVGFSHPVAKDMPAGITVACPTPDRNRDQGFRPPGGGPDRRRSSRAASARALQGQGHPLRGREDRRSKRRRRSKEHTRC